MAKFPIFESLTVNGYLLFPGREVSNEDTRLVGSIDLDHFKLVFRPGPWIVLGVNGLGKSTLLLLLKHVLVGAVRTREAGFTGDRADIISLDSRFFGVRVRDGARNAIGKLRLRIGDVTLLVYRNLHNLAFVKATIVDNDGERQIELEGEWKSELTKQMALSRFEDAVRVLDRIVFILEVRSPLILDVSAQFEIFRALLTPENSVQLRRLEAEIVSNDSSARNLNATLYKLSERRDKQLRLIETSADTHAQIAVATADRDKARADEARFQADLDSCQARRADARVQLKRCERDVDAAANVYEEAKYRLLRHAFAGVSPNEQYVFLKIISDKICLACGNRAEAAAQELERRRLDGFCLVCGAFRETGTNVVGTTDALQARAARAHASMERARDELQGAAKSQAEIETEYATTSFLLEQARQAVDREEALLRKLHRQLPASDRATISREEDRLAGCGNSLYGGFLI